MTKKNEMMNKEVTEEVLGVTEPKVESKYEKEHGDITLDYKAEYERYKSETARFQKLYDDVVLQYNQLVNKYHALLKLYSELLDRYTNEVSAN